MWSAIRYTVVTVLGVAYSQAQVLAVADNLVEQHRDVVIVQPGLVSWDLLGNLPLWAWQGTRIHRDRRPQRVLRARRITTWITAGGVMLGAVSCHVVTVARRGGFLVCGVRVSDVVGVGVLGRAVG